MPMRATTVRFGEDLWALLELAGRRGENAVTRSAYDLLLERLAGAC